jgi:hypothetical protein
MLLGRGAVRPTGMVGEHGIERSPGERLAGLVQPVAREYGVLERPPDAGDAPLVRCEGHVAGGRAADECHRAVHAGGEAATKDAERPRFGVDEADGDRRAGRQAEPCSDGLHHPTVPAADGQGALGQRAEPRQACEAEPLQQGVAPRLGVGRQIGPLAGEAAQRMMVLAGSAAGELVAQVAHADDAGECLRVMPRQPGELGRVHLRRHGAAGIVEQPVARCPDFLGLRLAAMVHPAEDVRVAGERRRPLVGQGEGGGGVEGEAGDTPGRIRAR